MKKNSYEDQDKRLDKVLKRIETVLDLLAKDRVKRIASYNKWILDNKLKHLQLIPQN